MRTVHFVALLICASVVIGCEKEVELEAPGPDAGGLEVEEPRGFALNWALASEHPAREVLEECHRLTDRQLAGTWVRMQDESDYSELAPYWGGPTEFESGNAKRDAAETYRDKAFEELGSIEEKTWCIELDVTLGEYNFDTQRFAVLDILGTMPDRTTSAKAAIERIELESGDEAPASYEHPFLMGLKSTFSSVAMRQGDAKPLIEANQPEGEESAGPAISERMRHLQKLHPGALRAVFQADRPEEKVTEGPNVFDLFQAGIEELTSGDVKLVAVVDPNLTRRQNETFEGRSFELKSFRFVATHAAFVLDGKVVEAFAPPDIRRTSSMPPWERGSNNDILEAVCGGSLSWDRRRVLSGGAIVEQVTPYCRRCPSFTAEAGDYSQFPITSAEIGAFDRSGGTAAIVTGTGCASRAEGEGYMIGVRRKLDGEWYISDRNGGLHDCVRVGSERTASALVCKEIFTGGGGTATGSVSIVDIAPNGELLFERLFDITDSWSGGCVRDAAYAWPEEMVRDDEGRVVISVGTGIPGPDAECGEEFQGDVHQVVVVADENGVSPNGPSASAISAIQKVVEGSK